ncbi:MAG: hypothetical protein HY314_13035 [Acidobacteria bacterium]|nr:hypothetical protein [Acidobacteriota bacterium]
MRVGERDVSGASSHQIAHIVKQALVRPVATPTACPAPGTAPVLVDATAWDNRGLG